MALSTYDLSLWEISRRALRSEKLKFSLDKGTNIDIQNLSNSISDLAPSIIIDINNDIKGIRNQIMIFNDERMIGLISEKETEDIDCIWIPVGAEKFWKDFERRVLHLVEAGYPGCIGCGGPGKDDVWNEEENRIKLRKEIN